MSVKKRQKSLASGRPPASRPKERMTSERSRTIIRTHHTLQKEHVAALKRGDTAAALEIATAIERNGGIKTYQAASKQGQAKDRGGDSSKILINWLQQSKVIGAKDHGHYRKEKPSLQCLEVGALSPSNEISKFPGEIHMTRIDLNSQDPSIEKQDLMERRLPASDEERFDIISLSLVLNYVPDATGRGDMLRRITKFLRPIKGENEVTPTIGPFLFLVLPLPCVDNSRYLDEPLLLQIMSNLGFTKQYNKKSLKLCYYLFTWNGKVTTRKSGKKKLRDKPAMNNFSIVLQ
ncbi:putative methyltransferase-domain-containing protein [Ampelomyces quisqualis]|uniref:25S rRNA adenine-N(1) methyltransferase n=1 Tax=Ampelomyces quisqualis TaxID=50730 RepID=A0A6A5QMR9_AMPQU|nr:putative methyltransferase-domain-containing protein [Ampelomyces quisqualis]